MMNSYLPDPIQQNRLGSSAESLIPFGLKPGRSFGVSMQVIPYSGSLKSGTFLPL